MGNSTGNPEVKASHSSHPPGDDDGKSEDAKEHEQQQQQQPQKKNAVLHKVTEAWCHAKSAYISQCVLMQALRTPCPILMRLHMQVIATCLGSDLLI